MSAARPLTAIAIGFSMGRVRLMRRPTILLAILGAALVVVSALVERHATSAGAADRALAGTFRLVIPLVCFGVAVEASGRGNLRDGTWSAARYGASRRDVALGSIAAALVASVALSAIYAALTVVVSGGGGALDPARDALTSAWIGALTAAAYVGWFSLGATFGRRGGGRWIPLALDFLVGGSAGFLGALLPRGNAESLLGGRAPMGFPQASSSALLAITAGVLCLLAGLRSRE